MNNWITSASRICSFAKAHGVPIGFQGQQLAFRTGYRGNHFVRFYLEFRIHRYNIHRLGVERVPGVRTNRTYSTPNGKGGESPHVKR